MWSVKYCLLVFIAVSGVLQLAAVHNNFRGLFFFPRKIYGVILAVLAIGFSLFTFFRWYVPSGIVVEGGQQTGSFVISAGAAILFTLVFSSIINNKRLGGDNPGRDGLEALRESTFFQAVRHFRDRKE